MDTQTRRALLYAAFVEHIDKRVVYDAYDGQCGICGESVSLGAATLDHIVPLCRGGKHSYANVQLAHGYCNRRKGNLLMEEMDEDLCPASAPKKKQAKPAYYNSRAYRYGKRDKQRRAA